MKPLLLLTRLREAVLYFPETGKWLWLKPNHMAKRIKAGDPVKESSDSQGHLQISIDGRLYLAHRLAWYFMTGKWPSFDIDHKDRDRKNNKWGNLRKADKQKNSFNSSVRKTNFLGLKGVGKHNNKFTARITVSEKIRLIGRFLTKEEASKAYEDAAKKQHGEFFCNEIRRDQ